MNVEFDKSFEKSLDRIRVKALYQKIGRVVKECESADKIGNISNIKKLSGFRDYYRIRIGEYRMGFELMDENTIRFIIIAHRKDIYRYFPK